MKAMTGDGYGSAGVLALGEVGMPVAGPDEVLIRVRAAGVGPDVWRAGQPEAFARRLRDVLDDD
jgi:NADPH:quinone reductase-like Zn-dependent oxidoreductase